MSDEHVTTVRGTGEDAGTRDRERSPVEVGTNIGRYVTLGVAGRGASGVVYAAYDPELDRKVALKVLGAGADDDAGSTRAAVLHEARALARLRHAHVVSVHDVGQHDGQVFVVMEFVDGQDLAQWIESARPRPAEVIRAMAQAGRGLAAAHVDGIIHRDFKPSNVLMGGDGRVLVADFGLAELAPRGSQMDPRDAELGQTEVDDPEKAPPGTPAYLAPELYEGREADVRSDVFAYCVTLWETLYGARPWTGETEMVLLEAKLDGAPSVPVRPRVANRVTAVLRAGLSPNPADRPASIQEVVAALEPPASRLPWVAVTGFATIGAVSIWALTQADPCDGAVERTEVAWSETTRSQLRAAILEDRDDHADEMWSQLEAKVDGYVATWSTAYREACEATHVRHEQSPELLDRRTQCLSRKLRQLDSMLEAMDPTSAPDVARATRALAKLTPRLACDVASLDGAVVEGPEADAILADLDQVEVLEALARYAEALPIAQDAQARAESLEADYLRHLALYRVGRLLDLTNEPKAAIDALSAVHHRAEAKGWNELAIVAGIYVVYEAGAVFNKPEQALMWEPHVSACVTRAGDQPRHRAALLDNVGVAYLYANEHEKALTHHQDALNLRESMPADRLGIIGTLGNIGIVLEEMGRFDEAITHQERALEMLQSELGEHHPHTARVIDNLGTAQLRRGNVAKAKDHFSRALETRRAILGPKHRSVATSQLHFGLAALEAGEANEAVEHYRAALEIYEGTFDAGMREVLLCHEGLAHAFAALKRWPEARAEAELALRGLRDRLPAGHAELAALEEIAKQADAAGPPVPGG